MESTLEIFKPKLERVEITTLQEFSEIKTSIKSNSLVFIFFMINEPYKWTVAKSYDDLAKFHGKFKKEAPGNVTIPKKKDFMNMNSDEKKVTLESFFGELLSNEEICQNVFFQEFFEVSFLSFKGTTTKFKEGYIKKQTGGRISNDKKFCSCGKYFKRFQKRWMIVRETGIVLSNDKSSTKMSDNLFFDKKFSITFHSQTGYNDGILIKNSKRNLLIRTGSIIALAAWKKSIEQALENSEYNKGENPYNSLFPLRSWNNVKIFVDGENYFRKVYQKLKTAKNQVFITDWWLSPELYLKRPCTKHPKSKLLSVLKNLADKGVSIYVHVFNEVSQALTLNSKYTVRKLREHPQIRAIRHPKRPLNDIQLLWSHHEKVICIDQEVAFLGGLDLCYGRMDNQKHKLKDIGTKPYWNGIDYSNGRVQDFENVEKWESDTLDRNKVPRMPWHDVGVMIRGDAAYDVSVNYIELWNHVMTDSSGGYVKNKDILTPLKAKPRQKKTLTNENKPEIMQGKDIDLKALNEIKVDREEIEMYRRESQRKSSERNSMRISMNEEIKQMEYEIRGSFVRTGAEGTCKCQIVRSAGGWSYGLDSTDQSIYSAYLRLIDLAEHFIYIENQFFISSTAGKPVENHIAQALVDKIIAMARKKVPFKVIVVVPLLPGFAGEVGPSSGNVVKIQLHWEYLTICRGPNSIYKQLEKCPDIDNPMNYIQFFGLRNHDTLSDIPVTEIVYIHSKLMVIDDKLMIIGSANINDRSMVGEHDSEIAVIISDKKKVEIELGGVKKKVSKTVHEFRMSIFKEFVGECKDKDIIDPLSISFVKEWEGTAESNTLKYRAVFGCYPDDEMVNYELMQKVKGEANLKRYSREKKEIKGFLVQFPLRFLENEDLKPSGLALENLLPDKGFI